MTKPRRKPRKRGRKTKFTPATRAAFIDAIERGAPECLACQCAGISVAVLAIWKNEAKIEQVPEKVQFLEAIEKARGVFRQDMLDQVARAARGRSWQAAAWYLERQIPEEFKRPEADTSNAATEPIEVVIATRKPKK